MGETVKQLWDEDGPTEQKLEAEAALLHRNKFFSFAAWLPTWDLLIMETQHHSLFPTQINIILGHLVVQSTLWGSLIKM